MTDKVISMAEFRATKEALEEGLEDLPKPLFVSIDMGAVDLVHGVLQELLDTGNVDAHSFISAMIAFGALAEEVWPELEAHIASTQGELDD